MNGSASSSLAPVVLPELPNTIVERSITNVRRKLVAGYRNKKNSQAGAKTVSQRVVVSDTLDATSASSVLAVSQRGRFWKEMVMKSLVGGISSLSSAKFDGEFTVHGGVPSGINGMPNQPGVYVVFNKNNQPVYVGDSTKLGKRWVAGHMNAYRQGKRSGEPYKLETVLEEGCTVKWITMDSEETAAALEAKFIREVNPPVNSRQELKSEQGKRSNIEAKKISDASGSTARLFAGAAKEAAVNLGFAAFEQLADVICFALKDELVDIIGGGTASLGVRVERFLKKVLEAVKGLFSSAVKLLSGLVEFVVNALSKAVGEIYALARNLCDLVQSAWDLYRGSQVMSRIELIEKISETILISGMMVFWDAIDPLLEAQLTPVLGVVAPYLAASLTAIGFGVSSYYLRKAVPAAVAYLIDYRTGWHEALDANRDAVDTLMLVAEQELSMVATVFEYTASTQALLSETSAHTESLREHRPIQAFDVNALIGLSAPHDEVLP